jgi:hypothetical protein
MSESKGHFRSIIDLPVATVGAILNSESEWIRYGLPAVLLTVIFFFAMRRESPPQLAPIGGTLSLQSRSSPANHPAMPQHGFARDLTLTVPGAPSGVAQRPAAPNVATAQRASVQEARRALCFATRVASTTPAIRRKSTVLRYAVSGYRGGGFQTAARAVNEAVSEYTAGKWNEDECPASPDGVRIAKGAIGEALR